MSDGLDARIGHRRPAGLHREVAQRLLVLDLVGGLADPENTDAHSTPPLVGFGLAAAGPTVVRAQVEIASPGICSAVAGRGHPDVTSMSCAIASPPP